MVKGNMTMNSSEQQRGIVLIVALITLLLISIVGVGIMTTVNLEEKMTATAVDHQRAFQAAESGLREGEYDASQAYPNFDLDSDPLTGHFAANAANGESVHADYTVEPIAVYRTSLEAGTATDMSGLLVRVTSRSDGLSGNADVVLQSTYLIEN